MKDDGVPPSEIVQPISVVPDYSSIQSPENSVEIETPPSVIEKNDAQMAFAGGASVNHETESEFDPEEKGSDDSCADEEENTSESHPPENPAEETEISSGTESPSDAPPLEDEYPEEIASVNDVAIDEDTLPADPVDFFKSFLTHIEKDDGMLALYCSQAKVSYESDGYMLRFPPTLSFQFSQVSSRNNLDRLVKDFSAYAGKNVPITPVRDENAVVEAVAEEKPAAAAPVRGGSHVKRAVLEEDIAAEPVIGSILRIFDGEVL